MCAADVETTEAYVAKNQLAKELFQEYKIRTNNQLHQYTHLKTSFPLSNFPIHAKRAWKSVMLEVIWGTIATKLSGGKIDYLREGGQK